MSVLEGYLKSLYHGCELGVFSIYLENDVLLDVLINGWIFFAIIADVL